MPRPMGNPAKKPLILITGSSGMLGKALIKTMRQRHEVIGVSRHPGLGDVSCDLSDERQVGELFKSHRPSLVIHCAAFSDVDGCERDPKAAYACNVMASKFLSEACAVSRVPWIYVSTDYVFGGQKTSPYDEKDATAPVNIYGLSKWCGEFYALASGVSSVIVRTSWLFGPSNSSNFVNAILQSLKKEKEVSVLDDQTDSPTSVKDLSQALQTIGEHLMAAHAKDPNSVWHDTFDVCNAGGTTRYDMTVQMKKDLGFKDVRVQKADTTQIKNRVAVRPSYAVMSTRHYENFFGKTLRPWQESLREYVLEAAV